MAMYELGLNTVVIPQLTAEFASVGTTLTAFGAIWLALSAMVFLISALLDADRSVAEDTSDAGTSSEDLRRAA
jgi:hypothetical protein